MKINLKNGEFLAVSKEFPMNVFEIQDTLDRLKIPDDNLIVEFSISGYDNMELPYTLCRREFSADIYRLNLFAERLGNLKYDEMTAFKSLLTANSECSFEDMLKMTYGLDSVMIYPCRDCCELGETVIENEMIPELESCSDEILELLDREKIGRLMQEREGGVFIDGHYCVTSDYEPPDINIEIGRPENCFFRLLIVPEKEKIDQAQWVSLPCETEITCDFCNGICLNFQSSLPNVKFDDTHKIDTLNELAKQISQLSHDDFVKLKAIMESENICETSDTLDCIGRLDEYQFDRNIFDHSDFGRAYLLKNRNGITVTMTYDKVGNLLSKTYPNGAKVEYVYNANYQLISETSTTGAVTKYEYDAIGRNTAIIDALGNRTEFEYNEHSQLSVMRDAKGNEYHYEYDLNGNRTKTVFPDGSSVSSEYDLRGRVTSQTDQHGNVTTYVYDAADRLTGVTDALGNTTSYAYDEVGDLISITDANGNITKYSYDDLSRLTKVTNALGKTAEMTYDECGNVLTSTDFAGKLTSYTYDEFDRISSKTTEDGTVTYSYTVDGKLSSVKDSTGTTKYTYDSMDGLKKVVYPNGEYVEYSYDDSCRLTIVKTAYGTTKYEWDKLDRLVRVVDRNGYATVYEYDKNGNRSAVKYANGIVITYKYDEVNRLISEKALDKQGGLVAQYEYTLGAAGERTKVKELDRTVEYTYDALYRLTGEKITAADKTVTEYTYAYDKVSNRILKTENGTKTAYTYNALNQLVKENDTIYKYDDAGNLISTTSSGKSAAYTYNAENKLIRATVQEGNNVSVEEYEYDYAGNRTVKKSENDYTYYLNDISSGLTQVLAELDKNGNEKCYYTRGAEIISQERSGNITYYLTDGHGSVRQLADSNGVVTDTYVYDAWGNLLESTGTTENSYLYCGEQHDSTTGLYYLRARYMNPTTGTFISMDTYQGSIFDPTSLHKYLYANANPVMNVDPTGYFTLAEVSISGAINNAMDAWNDSWAIRTYHHLKSKLELIDRCLTVYDTIRQAMVWLTDPDASATDVLFGIAGGIISGIFLKKMCDIKTIGPIISKIALLGGYAAQVKAIGDAIKNEQWDQVITQTFHLTLSILALSDNCFTGDTLVATENGQIRIDEIEVGDKVWAYDIFTGETELKEVTKVYVHEVDEILHLHSSCGDIDTTTNHPFYVIDKGWVAAGDLNEGDEVYLIDGSTAFITGAELEKLDEPIKVYNLEVADFNTYFVGDVPVLVHNYETEYDLYAAGRNGGNPSGRPKDFGLDPDVPTSTVVNGSMKPDNNNFEFGGTSSFQTLDELCSKLKNVKAFLLPEGTILPDGLGLKQDVPGGHNTLYPTIPMSLDDFYNLVRSLPWKFLGKR